ncbi:NAD(P)H-hydrate dehydratase [Qipengyuania sp. G39]|uniref:Bifunctional NAD(P)H-hydrate repair enzyme n=1 Tax=Qipengyuania profundimaris TaxID=3067652 RepID=A0ABT9HQE9_9SPHN|nr:NAD(P)H-hydrate dehydratase [Qipengyuania sp. G39]MDP4575381.1 NAD(P)H-hydrate dehydratase [Qipengyuania sp. G39]
MNSTAVLSVEAMRAAEQAAMNAGISEWELMQRAGQGAARWVMRMAAGRPVTVLCGPGNNGGDGYVIAGCLHAKGYKVRVIAPVEPKSETARKARAAFDGEVMGRAALTDPVVVDCLFGYGLSRNAKGEFANLLEELAASDCYKIAIDVPSSVESDSGSVLGPLPRYNLTLALGAWKQAHFLMPAMASMGALRCVPIGLALNDASDQSTTAPRLTAPAADSHKYRRGLLAVVAGSMPGAPLLSAEAAMHAGAGYVKLVSDHSHPDAPADLVIEQDLDAVLEDERISAVLTGPGLGRDDEARKRLSRVLGSGRPCVLDADALHLLRPDMLKGADVTKLCLTPHEGELATLCESFGVTLQSKLDRARRLHDVTGMTVLAKGPDTVLADREGMRFFPRGSSWLSVAGSGDVLAGIVASRLAVHSDTMRACEEAVWLHHEAARRAAPAFSASDLACALIPAMASFL